MTFPFILVSGLPNLIGRTRAELPTAILACWASIFFSLSALTLLISLAASQAFLAAAGALYAVHLLRALPSLSFPPVKLPLALFCLTTLISTLLAENTTVGWFAVRKLVLFLILLLGVNLIVSSRHLAVLYQTLFLEAAGAGLVGAGQFVVQYREVRALHPDRIYFYMTNQRIHGFMGHWMHFGGQQMLLFASLLALLLLGPGTVKRGSGESGTGSRETRAFTSDSQLPTPLPVLKALLPSPRAVWWLVLAIIVASIVLNLTRGVWLASFVATCYLVGRWKRRWLWALAALLVAGLFVAPSLVRQRLESVRHPSAEPSLSIRLEMWSVALRMIRRHPWWGVGPNNIPEVYTLYLPPRKAPEVGYRDHLHNNFLQLGAERGLPCLAAWIWFMAALGGQFWRIRHRAIRDRWVAEAAMGSWLAFLVEGCFEFNFGSSPVLMLFLFVASTPFVVERLERQSKAES